MIDRAAASISRLAAFLSAPASPVLAPYGRQRAPFEAWARKKGVLSIIALIGAIYGFLYALFPPAFLLFLIAPIAVLALIVVWALPDRNTAPHVLLGRLFFCYVVGMILWPNYLAIALPGLPWISMRRLIAAPMTLTLLICVSTSADFRRTCREALQDSPVIWKMLVGFVVAQTISIGFADQPFAAVKIFLNNQIIWTAIFFVSVFVFLKPGRIRLWASMICIMAVVLGIMGLVEFHNKQILWVGHIPSFLKIEDESVQRMLTANFRDGRYRVTTTFSVALSLAEYLALTSPFLAHIIMTTRKPISRLACLAAELLILTVIVLTQARLGLVGFITAHAIYGLLWSTRRWRTLRTDILGPALTLAYPALLVALGGMIMTVDALRYRVLGGGTTQGSNDAREAQWNAAGPIFLERPLGYGPGRGADALGYTNRGGVQTIDSYFLSIGLDYGIFGFLLFYGLIVIAIGKSAEIGSRVKDEELRYAIPVSICLLVFLIIKFVLSQEENNSILFMLLGMVVAMYHRSLKGSVDGQRST